MYISNPEPSVGRALIEREINTLLPWLHRAAKSIRPGRPDDQADLVQETLAKALRYCDGFTACRSGEPGEQLRSWLLTMMRNVQTSIGRKRWREQSLPEGPSIKGQNPLDALINSASPPGGEAAVYLREVLTTYSNLPQRQQTALRLAINGLNTEEAAKVMGVTRFVASQAMHRARNTLRHGERKMLDVATQPDGIIDDETWSQFSHIFPADKPQKWGAGMKRVPDRLILSLLLQMVREQRSMLQVTSTCAYCGSDVLPKRLRHWHKMGWLPIIFNVMRQQPDADQFHWDKLPAPYRPMH